jgi:hypothetical protein
LPTTNFVILGTFLNKDLASEFGLGQGHHLSTAAIEGIGHVSTRTDGITDVSGVDIAFSTNSALTCVAEGG